ncbi:MAG: hypothetical protein AB1649_18060 [Chloroflexota bacterium]
MSTNTPSPAEWQRLYELMVQFKKLLPWEWMEEVDIFGIENPETGELGFISVMGKLGEHLAIAVYQGAKGLGGFWDMQSKGDRLTPEIVLQVPQLQASLEDREMVEKQDRDVMKKLGLKFRGAQSWPLFRSYRPGCLPWYIEKEEAQMLIYALEQLLDVAPRFRENPDLFTPTDVEHDYLVRVKQGIQWKDSVRHIEFREEKTLDLRMNETALVHLRTSMPGKLTLEIDLEMMSAPVSERSDDRPYFPFMLMIADHHSGMILGVELLQPLPSMDAMYEEVPAVVVEMLASGFPPKEVLVKDAMLHLLLQTVAEEVGFKITKQAHLPMIGHAKREFRKFTRLPGF